MFSDAAFDIPLDKVQLREHALFVGHLGVFNPTTRMRIMKHAFGAPSYELFVAASDLAEYETKEYMSKKAFFWTTSLFFRNPYLSF